MPRLQFSFTCLGVDEEKGPPSFLHVFRTLPANGIPYTFPPGTGFFVVTGWLDDDGAPDQEHFQNTCIIDPEGQLLMDGGDHIFKLEKGSFMLVQFLEGAEFPMEGRYRVEIRLDGQPVLDYPLVIEKV